MKKLLVIGGSGFIGKSINDYIKNKKTEIIKSINYSRSNNKNILKINKLPQTDYILYLIKSNNIKKSLKYFNHFKNLLAKSTKDINIIFFSSGAIYGPRTIVKKFKETEIVSVKKIKKFRGYKRNYALEKYLIEEEFKRLGNEGYKVSIVRGFTFYGKYIYQSNYLISEIINAVRLKKKLIIRNSNVIRSYMHTDDMSRWILKIIKYSSSKCSIYNLGSSKILNLKKFISFLNRRYKSKISIKESKHKKTDFYVPSVNLAKNKFKLKNAISFNRAISLLIK